MQRITVNLKIYLEFHANEVGSVAVHAVDGDEAVTICRNDVSVLFELKTGHQRS